MEGSVRGSLRLLVLSALCLGLLLAPRPRSAAAQAASTGVFAGVVLDKEDRQPLQNARVVVYRSTPADSGWATVKDGLTDATGNFRYELPAGSYRVIFYAQSYTVDVRDDVVITPGGTVEIAAALTARPIQIQGIDVQGQEKRNTEASTLAKRKRADYVSDAISAEQISKSTDANAAEALQRVTGLSVVGGRYVYVRGMGERYSSTQVNGASLGTPEPNKRVVPLDLFPSGTLDDIVVQKSYTADQDGEFAGGVIQLSTRDFVEGTSLIQNLSTGYSGPTLNDERLTYPGGSLDFVGFDDGTRGYPGLFKEVAAGAPIRTKGLFGGEGFSRDTVALLGRSFNKTWTPRRSGSRPNYSYAGSYGRGFRLFGKEIGVLGSLSYSNGVSSLDRDNNAYSGTSTRLSPLYLYKVEETTMKMLGGALANVSARLAEGHAARLRVLYTRSAEDNTRIIQGPNYNYGTDKVRISSLNYIERGLLSGVLSGDNRIGALAGALLEWKASYSEAMRDEPDRRENVYESNGVGGMELSARTAVPLTRVFGDMNEYDRSASMDLSRLFAIDEARSIKVKAGATIRKRNRISSFRRLGFRLAPQGRDSLDTSLPPEELLIDENIRPGYFELVEETRENDQYRANHRTHAQYLVADLNLVPRLELQGGGRVETSDQQVEAKSPFVSDAKRTDVRLKNTVVLPAANLTYRFSETMNARLGYSITVSRPELREMSPFDMYDYETGYTEVGNPQIQSTTIHNYDARWELYPGTRELVAVSAFRKLLFEPIENVVLGSSGGYILSPRNGIDGRVRGVELEARVGTARIWNAAARLLPMSESPAELDHWALSVNYSRVASSVRVRTTTDESGTPVYRKGPLQGQSSYSLNAGIYYGSEMMDGSLLVSSFGQRLAQVGAGAYPSSLPDIYEHPPLTVDMTVSRQILSGFRVKLSLENLLDRATEFRQLDLVTRRYRTGRTVSVAMNFRG